MGELGCAYADGCLTAEEMILSAYSRGLVSLETPFIRGSMAAIGLGYQEVGIIIKCLMLLVPGVRFVNLNLHSVFLQKSFFSEPAVLTGES